MLKVQWWVMGLWLTGCPYYGDQQKILYGQGVCQGSGCDEGRQGCAADAACGADEFCAQGICQLKTAACQFDTECGNDRACLNGSCVARCGQDPNVCGSGQKCVNSLCVANYVNERDNQGSHGSTGSGSTSSNVCSIETPVCASGTECVLGQCLQTCDATHGCKNATDVCATDGYCRADWRPDPLCKTDADCASSGSFHVCRYGVCRTTCKSQTAAECQRVDAQLSYCLPDQAQEFLCYVSKDVPTAQCKFADDCTTQTCLNGKCQ